MRTVPPFIIEGFPTVHTTGMPRTSWIYIIGVPRSMLYIYSEQSEIPYKFDQMGVA